MMLLRRLLTLAVLVLACPLASQAAEPVFPPGVRVGLTPIDGLKPAASFPGFENEAAGIKVLIAELPAAAFASFEQAARSGKGPKPESFVTAAGKGFIGVESVSGPPAVKRWSLIVAADKVTAYVLAEIPEAAAKTYSDDAMRRMLASVALRGEVPAQEQLDQMPFKLNELSDFKNVLTLVPRAAVLLSDGTEESAPEDAPYIVVSVGTGGPAQADERARFAQNLLSAIPGMKDMRVVSSEPMRIAGVAGFETRVEGVSTAKNTPMQLVQWLRFGQAGFMRIVGGATKDEWPKAFPRFRAVRDGVDQR